jgi:hypothetical protein
MVVIVWKFFADLRPSMSVSGDFFEVLKLSDTSAGIFICDVMGHGVRAALVAPLSVLWWVNCEITWEIRVSCFPGSIGRFAQYWNIVKSLSLFRPFTCSFSDRVTKDAELR